MAYFLRTGTTTFRATSDVRGAWNPDDQHIAPAMGLLAHVVELDREARRDDGLAVGRLCYDIFGTVPVDEVETAVRVVRPGRTIELVEARLRHGGRTVATLRAWLLQRDRTADLAASPLPRIPPPEEMAPWDPSSQWPGEFLATLDVRRAQAEPGRAAFWIRTPEALVAGEPVSATARAAGLLDLANGMTPRAGPDLLTFPNVDLTAHFFAEPAGEWLGFDTSVSFGAGGVGVTSSVLHGAAGPIGTVSQILTLRRRTGPAEARR